EVPVAVILLVMSGMVTVEKLRAARGYVVVGAFVIAAVVTPPDVVSQFMLAVPLCLLFEVGVLLASAIKTKRSAATDDEAADTDEVTHPNDSESGPARARPGSRLYFQIARFTLTHNGQCYRLARRQRRNLIQETNRSDDGF